MKHEHETNRDGTFLVIWRKKGAKSTDKCKFCGKTHKHGAGEGHRIAHCIESKKSENYKAKDGQILHKSEGYILREY